MAHRSQTKSPIGPAKGFLFRQSGVDTALLGFGGAISAKLQQEKWGTSVVEQLSKDLKKEFPSLKGFSRSNLFYMKKFYEFYQDVEFVQQLVGQIPWGHHIVIFSKASSTDEAHFYLLKTIENKWSRAVLVHQIDLNLFLRSGKAIQKDLQDKG